MSKKDGHKTLKDALKKPLDEILLLHKEEYGNKKSDAEIAEMLQKDLMTAFMKRQTMEEHKEIYTRMAKIISKITKKIFRLHKKKKKSKKELREITEKKFQEECIGFPRVSESYRAMVERLANEKSSIVIPNGTEPYEKLFGLFKISIT
jgi:hypothetical protein